MLPSLYARLRMAAIMALAVYPVVTLYLTVLMPLTPGWAMWQRCLVLVPFMTFTIVLLIIPMITRHLGAFIAGRKRSAA